MSEQTAEERDADGEAGGFATMVGNVLIQHDDDCAERDAEDAGCDCGAYVRALYDVAEERDILRALQGGLPSEMTEDATDEEVLTRAFAPHEWHMLVHKLSNGSATERAAAKLIVALVADLHNHRVDALAKPKPE